MASSEISLESLGLVEELGGATARKLTDQEMERLCNGAMAFCEEMTGVSLHPYQREFAWRILYSLMIEDSDEITGIMARQSGKTESIAVVVVGSMVLLPILAKIFTGDDRLNKFKDGLWAGIYAPNYDLAGIMWNRMKLRLYSESAKQFLLDPSINIDLSTERNDLTLSNGSFVDCGTANPQSKIEGKTYNLILLEECQDIGSAQIRGSIHPMGAAVGGSIVKIGTPNRVRSDFYEACRRNKRNDVANNLVGSKKRCHFEYDYTVVQRYNPRYRKYIVKERERLGEDSEDFRLKYKLHWLSDKGVFISSDLLDECAITNVKEGKLIAKDKRSRTKSNYMVFERKPWFVHSDAETDGQVAGIDLGKDVNSTVVSVAKVWWDYPVMYGEEYRYFVHIQNFLELVGDDHEAQYPMIYDFLKRYNVGSIIIDATGRGDPIYTRMKYDLEGFGINVVPFVFTEKSKDVLYKVYLQELTNKRFTFPAGKKAVSKKEYTRMYSQMIDLEKFWRGNKMVVHKPKDSKEARDDFPDSMALTCYLVNINESMEAEMDYNPMIGRSARWMTADMIKKSGSWYRSVTNPKTGLGYNGRGRPSKRGKWE